MIDYKRVFLDTAPIIYYLQQNELYFGLMKSALISLSKAEAVFVSSDITVEEYCVYPYKSKNIALVAMLDSFISLAKIEVVHTSEAIAKLAAQIRAEYPGFKAMDALQISMAVAAGCDMFLTNDKQLRQFNEIACVILEDFTDL